MKSFNISGVSKLIVGPGKIGELSMHTKKSGNRLLLVIGSLSLKNSGKYDLIVSDLKKEGITIHEATVIGEPSPSVINEIVNKNKQNKIEVVCAIGGGSVVDVGKAVSAMLTEKDFFSVKDYLEDVGFRKPSGTKIPFIAVPTTSGTGSETTKNAVVSEVGLGGYKKSLRHDNFIPNLAIIDPELIVNCPSSISISSGLDALSQLLESYIATKANPFTDAIARDAIIRMMNNLETVCLDNSADVNARTEIAYAAFVSGITLAHAGLGTVHGIAGVIGGHKNVPHGVACGCLLPYWLETIVAKMLLDPDGYQIYINKLELLAGEIFPGEKKGIEDLVRSVNMLSQRLHHSRLSEFGVNQEDLRFYAEKSSNKNNPVEFSFEEKLRILQKAY
jgi:alcohol dehydrogenase class IV